LFSSLNFCFVPLPAAEGLAAVAVRFCRDSVWFKVRD
jgi:hypothetical protein